MDSLVVKTKGVSRRIITASAEKPSANVEELNRLDWPADVALGLGIVEIVCTLIYAIPQTAVLGAILLTGYLGRAIATHVRIDDPFYSPVISRWCIGLAGTLSAQ